MAKKKLLKLVLELSTSQLPNFSAFARDLESHAFQVFNSSYSAVEACATKLSAVLCLVSLNGCKLRCPFCWRHRQFDAFRSSSSRICSRPSKGAQSVTCCFVMAYCCPAALRIHLRACSCSASVSCIWKTAILQGSCCSLCQRKAGRTCNSMPSCCCVRSLCSSRHSAILDGKCTP